MSHPNLATSFALCVLLGLSSNASAKRMAVETAPPSNAVSKELLASVRGELNRAMSSMRIDGAPAPYFIAYKITEVDVRDVVASLGSTLDSTTRDFTTLEAHVHVGSYDRDNSNFVASRRESLDGTVTVPLAMESSPRIARRAAWLATDAAYKEAIAQWQAKGEAIASGASAATAKLPSYTKAPPIIMESAVAVPKLVEHAVLAERAKEVSAIFRDKKHIRDSRVAYTSFLENRWYLNSEGTNATDTRRVGGVLIMASAQAKDGQEIALYYTKYSHSFRGLPSLEVLKQEAEEISANLAKLIDAPLVENYTGPVLFEGEGAVGVVRYGLAPHLSGTPPPIGVSSDDALLAGKLVGRLGLKVLSDLLSVVDDPSLSNWNGTHLIGAYKFDDEGVAPKRVKVIKDGKLLELLMSRTPNSGQKQSNGHARLSMPGGVFRGSATNLIVSGKRGLSPNALRAKLLAEAKAQGLPYAIVIKQFDDPAITSSTEMSRLALYQVLQSMNPQSPPPANLAYRVFPDGREELVRGVQLEDIPMRAWRDVVAVGTKSVTKNLLATTDDPFLQRIAGVGEGRVPSAGIESAIITPDLLFEELDVRASKFGLRAPPRIPAP